MNILNNNFFDIKNKTIAFCGIGVSNLPLIKLFSKKGANIIACDKMPREKILSTAIELENMGVQLYLGDNYLSHLDKVDIVFRSPGINFNNPFFINAQKNGTIITSEMEVFFDLCPCKIIAVTGSDGKTTTTSIIYEILKHSKKTVHLGGNIGIPLLPQIEKIKKDDIVVVELSSFQLMSMRKSPDIAVITNLEPNHLDVHKNMNEYIDAKKNIFLHQNAFSRTVLNQDNKITNSFSHLCRGNIFMFSRKNLCTTGAFVKEGSIYICKNGKETKIIDTNKIKIPGNHNVENYLAAICAVWDLVSIDDIIYTAENFNGVEHRVEFIREKDGVKYYNDSIASSPTRTISGTLSLFDQKIILIAGGYDKNIPFDKLGPKIVDKVKTLILMGQTANKIQKSVESSPNYKKNQPKIINVQNMEEAVFSAKENSSPGDIVSLSPASASFGLYKNFVERGNHFKEIVSKL